MRFVDSRCIHCGASLRVAADATHVSCQYCNSELHVIHDGDRASTEVAREMHAELHQKLEVLRAQNELERLDREWSMERENYMVRQKHGGRSIPTIAGTVGLIIMAIFVIAFAVFWLGMANQIGAPGPFHLFGVFFIGVIVVMVIGTIYKATAHASAAQRYQSSRDRLREDLAKAEVIAKREGK